MNKLNQFFAKNKRAIIILLIALIIIGVAYYFTIGKEKLKDSQEGSAGSTSGSTGSSTPTTSTSSATSTSTFPIKWGVFNSYTKTLQARLNQSIVACNLGSRIAEDGILGSQTVAAIKQSFPNIGLSVEANRYVTQTQYSLIVNSQPNCV
jgi:hypothetical protein